MLQWVEYGLISGKELGIIFLLGAVSKFLD